MGAMFKGFKSRYGGDVGRGSGELKAALVRTPTPYQCSSGRGNDWLSLVHPSASRIHEGCLHDTMSLHK